MPTDDSTPILNDDHDPVHVLRIANRRIWLAYDSYAGPDSLIVYLELGMRGTLDLALTLNLLLSLCLEIEGAARGNVTRDSQTEQMIYRFRYTLDDDPGAVGLIDAIATLTSELGNGYDPGRY